MEKSQFDIFIVKWELDETLHLYWKISTYFMKIMNFCAFSFCLSYFEMRTKTAVSSFFKMINSKLFPEPQSIRYLFATVVVPDRFKMNVAQLNASARN